VTQACPGSEIYVGCSNGELLRFTLQADDPHKVCVLSIRRRRVELMFHQIESYSLLSRQSMPNEKPIDEIVLVPSIARALILSGADLYVIEYYTQSQSQLFLIPRTPSSLLHIAFSGSSPLEYNQTDSKCNNNCGRPPTSATTSAIVRPTISYRSHRILRHKAKQHCSIQSA
jgi:hypothetical protein